MKGVGFFPYLVDEGKHFALMFPVCGGLMICLKMLYGNDCILPKKKQNKTKKK